MSQETKQESTTWSRVHSEGDSRNEEEKSAEDFVNHGLRRWEEARAQWHASKSSDTDSTTRVAIPLDVDEIIDIIFSPRWRMPGHELGPPRRFPQNVPLAQMVDVLVDLWEAEGLDV